MPHINFIWFVFSLELEESATSKYESTLTSEISQSFGSNISYEGWNIFADEFEAVDSPISHPRLWGESQST